MPRFPHPDASHLPREERPIYFWSTAPNPLARQFSHFHVCDVEVEGVVYASAEHAFQAIRCLDPDGRWRIAEAETPAVAKALAKQYRADRARERDIMVATLRAKFQQHQDLLHALRLSGRRPLVHWEPWLDLGHPGTWGVGVSGGENWMGIDLMAVRAELCHETGPPAK